MATYTELKMDFVQAVRDKMTTFLNMYFDKNSRYAHLKMIAESVVPKDGKELAEILWTEPSLGNKIGESNSSIYSNLRGVILDHLIDIGTDLVPELRAEFLMTKREMNSKGFTVDFEKKEPKGYYVFKEVEPQKHSCMHMNPFDSEYQAVMWWEGQPE